MKVLMLSSDNNIFKEGSEARERMVEYGKLFGELHIIVFTGHQASGIRHQALGIGNNVFVYPTNSKSKWFWIFDAYKIGRQIIGNCLPMGDVPQGQKLAITVQDPFEIGLAGYFLKKKFGFPLQIQIHTDVFSPYFWRESLRNKIRVLLAKFLLQRADGIRVVSERIKQSLISNIQYPISNITVLPIFVDVEKIKLAPVKTDLRKKYPNYDFIILMASRLTREKNIPMALEAIRGLTRTLADFADKRRTQAGKILLLIVGDGPELKNLKLKTKNYKLKTNVVFEPWTEDLISYYKTADLFLLTSNYEGYGRTVVEAMAAGLPVAMADVGLAGEMIIDGVNGMVASSEKELTEKILALIRNKDKIEQFKEYNRNLLEKWPSREEYLKHYQKSLETLL